MHVTRLLAASAAAVTALAVPAAVGAAPATTVIKPGTLPQGADVALPHLEGKTVVDGDVRIRVRAGIVRLLGRSGTSYVVSTTDKQDAHGRLLTLTPDGTRKVLARGDLYEARLSSDGQTVFATAYRSRSSVVTAWDVASGDVVVSRKFRGFPSVLDARGDVALLGLWGRGTLSWDLATDELTRLTKRVGGSASLEEDLLSSYTADPYEGGCTVVSRISDTGDDLWKSCVERVESFAPGGRRMVTVHILSDGIGPNQATLRTVGGRLVNRYRVDGWFGALRFETPKALLLETNGKRQATTVRCVRSDCERAEDLRPAETPRAG